tara:strand:+ start:381 stop:515 length:135 start_codon:yes stop_codon:yes gene_type:complete
MTNKEEVKYSSFTLNVTFWFGVIVGLSVSFLFTVGAGVVAMVVN